MYLLLEEENECGAEHESGEQVPENAPQFVHLYKRLILMREHSVIFPQKSEHHIGRCHITSINQLWIVLIRLH